MRQVAICAIVVTLCCRLDPASSQSPTTRHLGKARIPIRAGTTQRRRLGTTLIRDGVLSVRVVCRSRPARGSGAIRQLGNMQRSGFCPTDRTRRSTPTVYRSVFPRPRFASTRGRPMLARELGRADLRRVPHGQLNYHGAALLLEGGPAHNDIETFRESLRKAFEANATNPLKRPPFVGRVLARRPDLSLTDVVKSLQCFGKASKERARI